MNKKTIILLCIILMLVLAGCTYTKINSVKEPDDISRMVLVENANGGRLQIYYDKYTLVMYMYNPAGGFSPIYNADGSLYLYGTPKTVG